MDVKERIAVARNLWTLPPEQKARLLERKITIICIWRGRFAEWSYQLQNDFKVAPMACIPFYYILDLWFEKIKCSLISTTEKEQVNVGK